MIPLLSVNNLTKEYKPGVGVFDVSLEVNQGEILGFIGPNGAGKTTTIAAALQFIKEDTGKVLFKGKEISGPDDLAPFMTDIGFLPGEVKLSNDLTLKATFDYAGKLYKKDVLQRTLDLAGTFNLDLNAKFSQLSLGNRKKAGIVNSLLHNPSLLILDEPTSSLDPIAQSQFLAELVSLRNRGVGVLMSSHVLSEVERICDKILMIKEGRIVNVSNTTELLNKLGRKFTIVNPSADLIDKVIRLNVSKEYQNNGQEFVIIVEDYTPVHQLLQASQHYNYFVEKPSLNDIFVSAYAPDHSTRN